MKRRIAFILARLSWRIHEGPIREQAALMLVMDSIITTRGDLATTRTPFFVGESLSERPLVFKNDRAYYWNNSTGAWDGEG